MHLHLQKDHCQAALTLTVGEEGEKKNTKHITWLAVRRVNRKCSTGALYEHKAAGL